MTATDRPTEGLAGEEAKPVGTRSKHNTARHVSVLLALASAAAGLLTLLIPDVLRGPAVMNGSARGTALVVLIALPLLIGSAVGAHRGADTARIVWLGVTAYLGYNAVMFLFATPFNDLFLVYLAMLSLAVATMITLVADMAVRPLRLRLTSSAVSRAIAVFVLVIAGLNVIAWLANIIPAIGAPRASFLAGTGMTTNPVYIQDLAIWLPLAIVGACWLWQRRTRGVITVGAILTLWTLESVSVAVDQWFAHNADPTSPVASTAMVLPFSILAAVSLAALVWLLATHSGARKVMRRVRR